jgi:hypothetical protein
MEDGRVSVVESADVEARPGEVYRWKRRTVFAAALAITKTRLGV